MYVVQWTSEVSGYRFFSHWHNADFSMKHEHECIWMIPGTVTD